MIILGLESSCDETAVALVNDKRQVLAAAVWSQLDELEAYGGVVPEVAARAHLERFPGLVHSVMQKAGVDYKDLSAVAATTGPGLMGGLIISTLLGRSMAASQDIPFIAINHLEGHALSCRLETDVPFPYLLLLVSGGHSEFIIVRDIGDYEKLGGTIDDAVGECFDKVARVMGLGFPGGPKIEAAAKQGSAAAVDLPQPLKGEQSCRLSFSGLKTAASRKVMRDWNGNPTQQQKADLSASLQQTIANCLAEKMAYALHAYKKLNPSVPTCVVAGGVAANQEVRKVLQQTCETEGVAFHAPSLDLCTDNAVMIAHAGIERLQAGRVFDYGPVPRWSLADIKTIEGTTT